MKKIVLYFVRFSTVIPFILLAACATTDSRIADRNTLYLGQGDTVVAQENNRPLDNVSYWDGDGVSGAPRIVVNLTEQRAYFYKGSSLVGVSQVSTGREGYGTPTGNFKVIERSPDHRSNLYGDYVDAAGNVVVENVSVKKDPMPAGTKFLGAAMPFFLRVHGGDGLHAGFLPGYPASHGCIRMPEFMARAFFDNAPLNTPVTITH